MLSVNYTTDNISSVNKMNSDPKSLEILTTGFFNNCILESLVNVLPFTYSETEGTYVGAPTLVNKLSKMI